MNDWLKTTVARLVIVGIAAALLFWLFAVRPVAQAKQLIKNQISVSAQNQKLTDEIQRTLASVPDLKNITTQQVGNLKNYADEVQQASTALGKLNIVRPVNLKKIAALAWGQNGQIVSSTNQAIDEANQANSKNNLSADWAKAKQLADYHTKISQALVNVLEYNPTVDTANLSLGSNDTNQRLRAAQAGLTKTLQQLQAGQGKYGDSSLGDIADQITSLQQARDLLAKDGNTIAWINAVSQAQAKIILNRSSFWQDQVKQIDNALNEDESVLNQYQKLWDGPASKYKL